MQCLTLLAEGFSGIDIERKTGVKQSAQSHIKKKAFDRGFRPKEDPRILELYVRDGERTGRPRKIDKVRKGKAKAEGKGEVEEKDENSGVQETATDKAEMPIENGMEGDGQLERPDANMLG